MFIIFGFSRSHFKKIGYRRSECAYCGKPQVFFLWRWMNWFNLAYIPFIPLGFDYAWSCSCCDNSPIEKVAAPLFLKLFGVFIFCLLLVATLFSWSEFQGYDRYIFLVLFLLPSVYFIFKVITHNKFKIDTLIHNSYKLDDLSSCLLCSGKLRVKHQFYRCESCGCKVYSG